MKRKLLLACASAALFTGMASAEVYVRVGPPRPIVERRLVSPGPGYVWTPGYQNWDGARYAWVPGRYVRPPRARAAWIAPRWVRRRGGWVQVPGRWR